MFYCTVYINQLLLFSLNFLIKEVYEFKFQLNFSIFFKNENRNITVPAITCVI